MMDTRESRHTPLPWAICGDQIVDADGFAFMSSDLSYAISPTWLDANPSKAWGCYYPESHREMRDGEGEANAKLIVRAVNAYPALVEALEWALAEIEGRTKYTSDEQFDNAMSCAREALALSARGDGS